jgi:hypothetical protein
VSVYRPSNKRLQYLAIKLDSPLGISLGTMHSLPLLGLLYIRCALFFGAESFGRRLGGLGVHGLHRWDILLLNRRAACVL